MGKKTTKSSKRGESRRDEDKALEVAAPLEQVMVARELSKPDRGLRHGGDIGRVASKLSAQTKIIVKETDPNGCCNPQKEMIILGSHGKLFELKMNQRSYRLIDNQGTVARYIPLFGSCSRRKRLRIIDRDSYLIGTAQEDTPVSCGTMIRLETWMEER